jgi:hypothetical protein
MTRHPNPEATTGSKGNRSAREVSTAATVADQQNYAAGASTTAGGGAQANSS